MGLISSERAMEQATSVSYGRPREQIRSDTNSLREQIRSDTNFLRCVGK
jgi:hypothetical protein